MKNWKHDNKRVGYSLESIKYKRNENCKTQFTAVCKQGYAAEHYILNDCII